VRSHFSGIGAGGEAWVAEGVRRLAEYPSGDCPFCAQRRVPLNGGENCSVILADIVLSRTLPKLAVTDDDFVEMTTTLEWAYVIVVLDDPITGLIGPPNPARVETADHPVANRSRIANRSYAG
jgi:hypothetical protein